MTPQTALGAEIQRARYAHHDEPSLEVVAKALGVAATTLSGYERGRIAIPALMLLRLAEFYGVNLDDWARVVARTTAPMRGRPPRDEAPAFVAEREEAAS